MNNLNISDHFEIGISRPRKIMEINKIKNDNSRKECNTHSTNIHVTKHCF